MFGELIDRKLASAMDQFLHDDNHPHSLSCTLSLTDPSAVEQEGLVGLVVQLIEQILALIKA